MRIQNIGRVVCATYELEELQGEKDIVNQIAENTDNTWQQNREKQETVDNTEQGKIAERMVEVFIEQEFGQTLEICSYDSIRCDNLEKHAPFDFLIWERGTTDIEPVVVSIQNDIRAATGRNVRISEYTRRLCKTNGIKIVEVKSTKIGERHIEGAGFNGDYEDDESVAALVDRIIQDDDFLCYPAYKRREERIDYSIEDYCNEVRANNTWLTAFSGTELRDRIVAHECSKQLCDLFVRVYIDEIAQKGFIIGWIRKEELYSGDVQFKRMIKRDKSECALYWAKRLIYLKQMSMLNQAVIVDRRVYASRHTTREFYHKDRNCIYINNVADEDIYTFNDENEAVRGGRFTKRCLRCYHE